MHDGYCGHYLRNRHCRLRHRDDGSRELRRPELSILRGHLNRTSTLKAPRLWNFLVVVLAPAVLSTIFVATLVSLLRDGYGDYPTSFIYKMGWLMLLGVMVASFILAVCPWRTPVDHFDPVAFHDRPESDSESAIAGHSMRQRQRDRTLTLAKMPSNAGALSGSTESLAHNPRQHKI
ncbi:hypothetical protein [Trueperella sp. LYQ143]|uniref:hypothetical protein n=1 Tax=Trueperella sp. LYQ143 TaxID=3391059 RepID=UPI0039834649